jgi:hypothetical protein
VLVVNLVTSGQLVLLCCQICSASDETGYALCNGLQKPPLHICEWVSTSARQHVSTRLLLHLFELKFALICVTIKRQNYINEEIKGILPPFSPKTVVLQFGIQKYKD